MRALTRLVLALFVLFGAPGCADEKCSGLKHLENGRTFFRYGGLYVTFTCNPGFRVHGYRTNSCVSGRWSRDPPVCVASGCPSPGWLLHGSSTITQDRSFVAFTCDRGYKLFGAPLLYCRGKNWNGTKPVCKESDIMNSDKQKHLDLLRFKMEQNLHGPLALKNLLQFQYKSISNTASKDVLLKPGLLAKEPAGALKELPNKIPLERKHLTDQAFGDGRSGTKEIYKEPVGYDGSIRDPLVPLTASLPTTIAVNLSPMYSSLSLTGSTSAAARQATGYPEQGLSTSTVGATTDSLHNRITSRTVDRRTHATQSSLPLKYIKSSQELTSLDHSDTLWANTLQFQAFTTELMSSAAEPLDLFTSEPASSSSLDQVTFQSISVSRPPLHQLPKASKMSGPTEYLEKTTEAPRPQDSITSASGSMADISTSGLGPESHVTSTEGAPAKLQKLTVQGFTARKLGPTYLSSMIPLHAPQEGSNGKIIQIQQHGPANATILHPTEGTTPMAAQIVEENSTSQYAPEVPTNLYPTDSSGMKVSGQFSVISVVTLTPVIYSGEQASESVVTGGQDSKIQQQGISLAETEEDLLTERKTTTTQVPSSVSHLEPGQTTNEPTHVTMQRLDEQPHTERRPTPAASLDGLPVQLWTSSNSNAVPPYTVPPSDPNAKNLSSVSDSLPSTRVTVTVTASHTLPGEVPVPYLGNSLLGILPSSQPAQGGVTELAGLHKRRPVCPYPPLPAHGTFYFRTVANPGPLEYKHFIQYACYPGYTLANGDVHSYCLHGGKWSGITPVCLEVTPCSVNNGGCSQLCTVDPQNQAQCQCRPGFQLLEDSRTCRDTDECAEGLHRCQQMCVNTFGSHTCSCGPGFLLSGDAVTCGDRDECAVNNGGCAQHCANTIGSFRCFCEPGFQLANDLTRCQDVDECLLPIGQASCLFGCINTRGSFRCHCPEGYRLASPDGHCIDIDECAENDGRGLCAANCQNTPGSFRCSCSYGYVLAGDGRSCIAECPAGYRKRSVAVALGSSPGEHCVDVNECQEPGLRLQRCEWKCINLPGSHRCICPRGYRLGPDGHQCQDINECLFKNGGCSHICINHNGGYKCACPEFHRLSPFNRKKCQAIT